jgi:hypothetical protein
MSGKLRSCWQVESPSHPKRYHTRRIAAAGGLRFFSGYLRAGVENTQACKEKWLSAFIMLALESRGYSSDRPL